MAKQHITPAQALEALHVFTSLATPEPSLPAAFEYSKTVPMTDFNALPALVVWLFLVTDNLYLDQLDAPPHTFDGKFVVSVESIAKATNLTVSAVNSILDVYRAKGGTPLASAANTVQDAFKAVASSFDAFSKEQGYPIGPHCAGSGQALLQLAKEGALVDPNATSFPSSPS